MTIVVAITIILIGIFFFARAIGFVNDETMNIVWPLLIVVLGLGVLAYGNTGHKCKGKNCWTCDHVEFANKKGKKKRK